MGDPFNQLVDLVPGIRVMVIGQDVATVQRVSRYCLEQGADVFPYYGIPNPEDVALFAPEVSVVCLPVSEDFLQQIAQPYILWSQQINQEFSLVSIPKELEISLHNALYP